MEKYQNTINYIDYLFDLSSFYSTALALKPAEIGNVEVHFRMWCPAAAMPQVQPMPDPGRTHTWRDQLASIGIDW